MDKEKFGVYIKTLREEKKLTLKKLGEKIGYSDSYISLLENGKKEFPSILFLVKLADGLGVDYNELLSMAGYANEKAELAKKANEAIKNNPALLESMAKMELAWQEANNFIELSEVFSEKNTLAIDGQLLTKDGKLLTQKDKAKILEMIKLYLS